MASYPENISDSKAEKANLGNQLGHKHSRFVQLMQPSVLRAPTGQRMRNLLIEEVVLNDASS